MNPVDIVSTLTAKLREEHRLTLKIKVVPKSKQNQLIGWLTDDILKVKIAAVPEKGKANQELIEFLSETFEVQKNRIEILQGETSVLKTIKISAS